MADKEVRLLSDEELKLIQGMLDRERRGLLNPQSRPPSDGYLSEFNDHQAADCYIALPTTSAGIPALTRTGTSSGSGTGVYEGDTPGSAECNIYQIVDGSLLEVVELGSLVYNLNEVKLSQTWVLVTRTKFGEWVALATTPASRRVKLPLGASITGTGTGTATDFRIFVTRVNTPLGIECYILDGSGSPSTETLLVYADCIRSVFVTDDEVWVEYLNGKWQIRDSGTLSWTGVSVESIPIGTATATIAINTRYGAVTVPCYIFAISSGVIPVGSSVSVWWDDSLTRFYCTLVSCPTFVTVGTGTGTGV